MNKRVFTLITSFVLIVSLFLPMQAFAAEESVEFTYISSVTSSLEISSGQAYMYSSISAYAGIDQVRMSNYLQKYENGAWSTVNSWTKLADATYSTWSTSYSVTSGTYRLRTYFYVYVDSVVVESTSLTTANQYC